MECNGDNTGSIVLGDPTDPDFLNAITSVTPGREQISMITFTPTNTQLRIQISLEFILMEQNTIHVVVKLY